MHQHGIQAKQPDTNPNCRTHLYEVQEQAKLTYTDKTERSGDFWVSGVEGLTWKGPEGASWSAGNNYVSLDGIHTNAYVCKNSCATLYMHVIPQ